MKDTIFLLSLAAGLFLCSCAGMGGASPEQKAKREQLQASIDSIKIGTSRKTVEAKLGRPTSISESPDAVTVTYMLGMDGVMESAQAAQKQAMGLSMLSSAVGALGMFGGANAAMATGLGSQASGMGGSMAAQGAMASADPTQIQNVNITYRNNKVYSIQRMNVGG
jgi:hypothetical protein